MIQEQNDTIKFAQSELHKYWNALTSEKQCNIKLIVDESSFNVPSSTQDDAFCIRVSEGEGVITAVNARSLLLAVYRFVETQGVRFLFPGENGESVPAVKKADCTVELECTASYRHRGICIEGAVSIEHVMGMIDWSAKLGFNAYFIQFRDAHNFFDNWYSHKNNPFKDAEPYSVEQSKTNTATIIREINKRGLSFHAVGHGWTNEAVGVTAHGWYAVDDAAVSENVREYLAEIDGKRAFFDGVPLNTHLCYSNPVVRELFVSEVVRYTLLHKDVDALHIWLADRFNNLCECNECQEQSVSDLYVMMLNEIDARLTTVGNTTKIVFLIYLELLWSPEHEKLINQDRFVLMYAPIHRTYARSYLLNGEPPAPEDCKVMEFNRNQIEFQADINSNLAFLYAWQQQFTGDSFLFDYHLMWAEHLDPAQMRIAKVIHDDVRALKELDLNGLVSCQLQRVFFPNGFAQYVMGKTLFDRDLPYDAIVREYFEAAYGEKYRLVLDYLTELSSLFSTLDYLRSDVDENQNHKNYISAVNIVQKNTPIFAELSKSCSVPIQRMMYQLLLKFNEIVSGWSDIMARKSAGAAIEELEESLTDLRNIIWETEDKYHPFLDSYFFVASVENVVRNSIKPV